MLKLQVKRGFYDKKAKKYRSSGEIFEVSESRAKEVLAAGVAKPIGKVEKKIADETGNTASEDNSVLNDDGKNPGDTESESGTGK